MRGRHVIWRVYEKGISLEGDYFESRTEARKFRNEMNDMLEESGFERKFRVQRVPMNWLKRIWFFVTGRRIIK